MGTWDIGPFDNDTAADFADDLDEAEEEGRESVIRAVLTRAARSVNHLETPDGERAVAAAALVVARHPAGEPLRSPFAPAETLPALDANLVVLAVEALDRVVSDQSEIAELWAEAVDGLKWRHDITRLRNVLDPPVPQQEETLFDFQDLP
ncbi:DUF4259 domain-containing protein [Streptomyces sp. NPDC055055]